MALGAGLGFFALGAAADLAGNTQAEEYMELCSGIGIAGGLAALMYSHLRHNLRPELVAPGDVPMFRSAYADPHPRSVPHGRRTRRRGADAAALSNRNPRISRGFVRLGGWDSNPQPTG